jgi:hypothetical protein
LKWEDFPSKIGIWLISPPFHQLEKRRTMGKDVIFAKDQDFKKNQRVFTRQTVRISRTESIFRTFGKHGDATKTLAISLPWPRASNIVIFFCPEE